MEKKIILLGGYGYAGRYIAEYLLKKKVNARLFLAGRRLERCREVVNELRTQYPGQDIQALRIDAAEPASLVVAFREADLVINAASTIPWTRNIAEALLATGVACIDTQLSLPDKLKTLQAYAARFREKGVVCITDSGFHPGIPGVLVRYAATQVDELASARIYSALKIDWADLAVSVDTQAEMMEMFRHFRPLVWKEDRWVAASYLRPQYHDFGPPFGRLALAPMFLHEMEALPAMVPGLREAGFWINGFNPVLDYLLMPVLTLGLYLTPGPWRRRWFPLFRWGLRFTRPPYLGVKLEGVFSGRSGGTDKHFHVSLFHPDAYALTAIPVVACALQWLDGQLREPGWHFQSHVVEPFRFLADLREMGVTVEGFSQPVTGVPG